MSGFEVIPAVDIKGGRCVRLLRGVPSEETVFSEDPAQAALRWQSEGAELLHVVDLDGAFAGVPVNEESIRRLVGSVDIAVEVGGGIRDLETARHYLRAGALRVIMGTAAFQGRQAVDRFASELGDRLVVGVDIKDGAVATSGWTGSSGVEPLTAVRGLEESGVRRIVYTDVSRDGTLEGPNFQGVSDIAGATSMKVIASGGVGSTEQIRTLAAMRSLGVEGVIVGMALYRGSILLPDALNAASVELE